jgi:hypothetical protein
MLISYNIIRGTLIMIWVTTSGGVRMAEPAKKRRRAYFRFRLRKETLTRPRRARKVRTRGS